MSMDFKGFYGTLFLTINLNIILSRIIKINNDKKINYIYQY